MCGFVAGFGEEPDFRRGLVEHRGPDQSEVLHGNGYRIEFNRLDITGREAGRTPVVSADGRWTALMNGEVYNFQKLKQRHALPNSPSDTVVVAEGVAKCGLEFLRELRGMFAGILIDNHTQQFFVFRDALGEKPAFWCAKDTELYVASEVSALIEILGGEVRLGEEALLDFLKLGFVEEPKTISRDCHAVPRGSVQRVNVEDQCLEFLFALPGYSEDETSRPLVDLIQTVFDEQTFREVPSAVSLSAGMDSSAITIQLARHRRQPVETFAISVDVGAHWLKNEAVAASRLAKRLKLPFIRIEPQAAADPDVVSLEEFSSRSDQPIGDISGPLYMEVFRMCARVGAKVVFLGHGADEFFWGYDWVSQLVADGPGCAKDMLDTERFSSEISVPAALVEPEDYTALSGSKSRSFLSSDPFLASESVFQRTRAVLVHSYLAHNGFAQSDRLAMSFSIEPRSPMGDSRLYGWAQTNVSNNDVRAFRKRILKSSLKSWLPSSIRNRRKQGFLSPWGGFLDRLEATVVPAFAPEAMASRYPWYQSLEEVVGATTVRRRRVLLHFWLRSREARGFTWVLS